MVNTSLKGQLKERQAREELASEGWIIGFKAVRAKYMSQDLFGLFDIMCYKNENCQRFRKYISVKHLGNSNYYLSHQREITGFKNNFGKEGESFELWLWEERKGWKKIIL
jgi:hypothetical protein